MLIYLQSPLLLYNSLVSSHVHTAHLYNLFSIASTGTAILQAPYSQLVLPDAVAIFTCTVQTYGDYYVYINGYPLVPGDQPGVTINVSDPPNTDDVHIVTVSIFATLDVNKTTVQCAIDQYDGDQLSSAIVYLWIAGKQRSLANKPFDLLPNEMRDAYISPAPPLPPNPSLTQLNSTTLSVSWTAPFTQTSVAGILNYTVRMFNTVSRKWKFWILPASLPNTSSCHQADISEGIVHDCVDAFYRNNSNESLQIFLVTKALPDFNCDEFVVYVSASNVLGESESAGIKGTFATGMFKYPIAIHACIL